MFGIGKKQEAKTVSSSKKPSQRMVASQYVAARMDKFIADSKPAERRVAQVLAKLYPVKEALDFLKYLVIARFYLEKFPGQEGNVAAIKDYVEEWSGEKQRKALLAKQKEALAKAAAKKRL